MQAVQPEGAPQEGPSAPAPGPNIHWEGPPRYMHNGVAHYRAANVVGQQISIGSQLISVQACLSLKIKKASSNPSQGAAFRSLGGSTITAYAVLCTKYLLKENHGPCSLGLSFNFLLLVVLAPVKDFFSFVKLPPSTHTHTHKHSFLLLQVILYIYNLLTLQYLSTSVVLMIFPFQTTSRQLPSLGFIVLKS